MSSAIKYLIAALVSAVLTFVVLPSTKGRGQSLVPVPPMSAEQITVGQALRATVRRELARLGVKPGITIDVGLTFGPSVMGRRHTILTWAVSDASGKRIGVHTQQNLVPDEAFWRPHKIWDMAAIQAADGIARMVWLTGGEDV